MASAARIIEFEVSSKKVLFVVVGPIKLASFV